MSDIFGSSIVELDPAAASPKHRTISKKDLEQVRLLVTALNFLVNMNNCLIGFNFRMKSPSFNVLTSLS